MMSFSIWLTSHISFICLLSSGSSVSGTLNAITLYVLSLKVMVLPSLSHRPVLLIALANHIAVLSESALIRTLLLPCF